MSPQVMKILLRISDNVSCYLCCNFLRNNSQMIHELKHITEKTRRNYEVDIIQSKQLFIGF